MSENSLIKPVILCVIGVDIQNKLAIVRGLLTKSDKSHFSKVCTDKTDVDKEYEHHYPSKPKDYISGYTDNSISYWHSNLKHGDIIIADSKELVDLSKRFKLKVCIPEKDVPLCDKEILSIIKEEYGLIRVK